MIDKLSEVEDWCKKWKILNPDITPEGVINTDSWVDLCGFTERELPFKFGRVGQHFRIDSAPNLVSMKNFPDVVGENLMCRGCKNLQTLKGFPKIIHGNPSLDMYPSVYKNPVETIYPLFSEFDDFTLLVKQAQLVYDAYIEGRVNRKMPRELIPGKINQLREIFA
jgi:hypothetical protein